MDKESLSQYGWVIIIIVVLAALILVAPNFATTISENINGAVNKFEVIANNGGMTNDKDYTEYSMDDINANEDLTAVGGTNSIYVVAKSSNEDTVLDVTKNTEASDGRLMDFPSGTSAIWYGTKTVILHNGITYIGSNSIANSPNVTITIPESVTEIHSDAFVNCANFTIKGVPGSYAESFAVANGYNFVGI